MSNSWTGSLDTDEEESEVEDVEPEPEITSASESSDVSENATEAENVVSEEEGEVSPPDEDEVSDTGSSTPSGDASDEAGESDESVPIPGSAMTLDEAAQLERRWKILVWGPPGLFKSHFCYTSPEPVAYIDLEGKADDIAGKFDGKQIALWQPSDFYQARDALHDALDWLEHVEEKEGKRGTIVVDSMSVLWEISQYAYVEEAYPTDDPEEKLKDVFQEFNLNDWKWIKNKHNAEFRRKIVDSPFHFVWTAGEKTDIDGEYGSQFKADGERNNAHKADTIIRARKDERGVKVGDMVKSNFSDRLFRGLPRPTFDRVVTAVKAIEEAESNPGSYKVSELEDELEVEIVRHDPLVEQEDD